MGFGQTGVGYTHPGCEGKDGFGRPVTSSTIRIGTRDAGGFVLEVGANVDLAGGPGDRAGAQGV